MIPVRPSLRGGRLMARDHRLTKAKDFAAVRRVGGRWSDNLLVLRVRPNGLSVSRYGFSVGKRLGKAVIRNKIKRRLREAVAIARADGGWDLLIVARREASSADFHQLRRSLATLMRRAGIVIAPPEDLCRSSRSK